MKEHRGNIAPYRGSTAGTEREQGGQQGGGAAEQDEDVALLSGYQIDPQKEATMSPKKYYKGEPISAAWQRMQQKNPEKEYEGTCVKLKSKPNSRVCQLLKDDFNYFGVQDVLNFRDNYLGEKGFLAILPLINSNTCFTHLDAANNGLKHESVTHLVDMLLRPRHADRQITLDLSRNPISVTGYQALAVLAARHPTVMDIDLRRTQVPRRKIIQLREFMATKRLNAAIAERERVVAETAAAAGDELAGEAAEPIPEGEEDGEEQAAADDEAAEIPPPHGAEEGQTDAAENPPTTDGEELGPAAPAPVEGEAEA